MPAKLNLSDAERAERRKQQRRESARRRRARNPEHVRRLARENHQRNKRKRPAARRLYTYGLSEEQFEALRARQGDCCAICARTDSGRPGHDWYVDHNHVTGKVRGLLCLTCNAGLGQFYDNPVRLRAAAQYLEDSDEA